MPTLALPVVVIVLLPAAMIPMMLPAVILPVPVIIPLPNPRLPTLALPVPVLSVPATFTPVPVTTRILALPTALMLTLPLAAGMLMFELPLACAPIILAAERFPLKFPVPVTFTPVLVKFAIIAPATAIGTLPPLATMLMLLVPFAISAAVTGTTPVILEPSPFRYWALIIPEFA